MNIYLVNNKKRESSFKNTFLKLAKEKKLNYTSLSSLDCAFSYSRKTGVTNIYHNGNLLDTSNSSWFIRAWSPSIDASALLCIILKLKKIPFTDSGANTLHEIRTSKLSQTFQFAAHKCQSPSTWVVTLDSFKKHIKLASKDLGFPLVVKTRGGLGKQVWKCDNKKELLAIYENIKMAGKNKLMILQELIPNEGDIRVVVWKGKVITCIARKSTTGFLNNVSQGGIATKTEITKKEAAIAIKASKILGLDLAGVDLVRLGDQTLIFEVNKAPDITSFHKAAGMDIAKVIIEDFLK
jgi:RimK family alpha-L-glutamate ligase